MLRSINGNSPAKALAQQAVFNIELHHIKAVISTVAGQMIQVNELDKMYMTNIESHLFRALLHTHLINHFISHSLNKTFKITQANETKSDGKTSQTEASINLD